MKRHLDEGDLSPTASLPGSPWSDSELQELDREQDDLLEKLGRPPVIKGPRPWDTPMIA